MQAWSGCLPTLDGVRDVDIRVVDVLIGVLGFGDHAHLPPAAEDVTVVGVLWVTLLLVMSYGRGGGPARRLRRHAPGASPTARLNARLNAASD